jgi:hypothetical protein
MERRTALKNVGFSLGSLLTIPAWADNWNKNDFKEIDTNVFSPLEALVDCIIPESESPGARSIGAHLYIDRMLKDCYEPEVQTLVNTRLKALDSETMAKFKSKFADLKLEDRISVFSTLENSSKKDERQFFSLVKSLTIRAYTSSEYYLKNYRDYEMAPGYFNGCVSV